MDTWCLSFPTMPVKGREAGSDLGCSFQHQHLCKNRGSVLLRLHLCGSHQSSGFSWAPGKQMFCWFR